MATEELAVVVFRISTSVPQFIDDAKALKVAVTTAPGSTRVTIDPALLTQFDTDMGLLETAQAKVNNHTGNAADRNVELNKIKKHVRSIVRTIQQAADAAPDEEVAIAIIQDCGCRVKLHGVILRPDIEVRNASGVAGLVHLISAKPAETRRYSVEWHISVNGTVFTYAKAAIELRTTYLTNAAPGTKLYFKKRFILPDAKGGTQAFSQIVFVIVM